MYRVEFYKQAARYYEKLDAKIRRRINAAIEDNAQNPFEGPHIERLKGKLEGKYRYSVGGLMVIYAVDEDHEFIYVEAIGPRGNVYK